MLLHTIEWHCNASSFCSDYSRWPISHLWHHCGLCMNSDCKKNLSYTHRQHVCASYQKGLCLCCLMWRNISKNKQYCKIQTWAWAAAHVRTTVLKPEILIMHFIYLDTHTHKRSTMGDCKSETLPVVVIEDLIQRTLIEDCLQGRFTSVRLK